MKRFTVLLAATILTLSLSGVAFAEEPKPVEKKETPAADGEAKTVKKKKKEAGVKKEAVEKKGETAGAKKEAKPAAKKVKKEAAGC